MQSLRLNRLLPTIKPINSLVSSIFNLRELSTIASKTSDAIPVVSSSSLITSPNGVRKFEIKVTEKDVEKFYQIPQSPLKVNLLVKPLRGAWLPDALATLKFTEKRITANEILRILKIAVDKSYFLYQAIPEELEIAEIRVNKGHQRKNMTIHGRGRVGIGYIRMSKLWITIKNIDFDQRIKEAKTTGQRLKWEDRKVLVERLKSGEIPPMKQLRARRDDAI